MTMKKLLEGRIGWAIAVILFIGLVYTSNLFTFRADLTAEKRFTVSAATKKVLNALDSTVTVQVFLTGDLPADYRKLNQAVQDLLTEFKSISGGNLIKVSFEKPGESIKDDTAKVLFYDSLARLGVVFEQAASISSEKEKTEKELEILQSQHVA